MNICLVSQEYPPETPWGGIGTQTRIKAQALARRGHNVHVLSRAADRGPEIRTETDAGVTVHRMQPPGFDFPIYGRSTYLLGYTWHVLRHLNRLMERIAFDVVDFPEFGGEGFAYLLDRTCWNWLPVVVQLHGPLPMFVEYMGWPQRGTRFERFGTFMEELSVQRADARMACSTSIADLASRYFNVPRDSIDVIHCGVDADLFRPPEYGEPRAERPTVLFVGNIVENKGIHIVLEAVLRLRSRYPDIRFQILGGVSKDSELVQDLQARRTAEGAAVNIEFVGFVPAARLPEYYRRAHVFCSPAAENEGLANVYLEAMACGCPVVASTAGGGPEAVTDGETGLVVPPRDVEATAEALDRILGNPPLGRRMGEAGRRRVEEYFAMDKYILRVLAIYEKAITRSQQLPERGEDVRV